MDLVATPSWQRGLEDAAEARTVGIAELEAMVESLERRLESAPYPGAFDDRIKLDLAGRSIIRLRAAESATATM